MIRFWAVFASVAMISALGLSFYDPNVAWTALGILGGAIWGACIVVFIMKGDEE